MTSKDAEFGQRYNQYNAKAWEHEAGRQCFRLEIPEIKRSVSSRIVREEPSPFEHKRYADRKRVEALHRLHGAIESHFDRQRSLPQSLQELEGVIRFGSKIVEDPDTKESYEYKILDELHYELCVTFEIASKDAGKKGSYGGTKWAHEAGHQCFEFEVSQ